MNNNKLVVYSASAGSGKTFSLVVEYVCMLIDYLQKGRPLGFRSILAVTFTNASTKEMKDRIIDVLISLSDKKECENSQYLQPIKDKYKDKYKTDLSSEEISDYSNRALHEIIHNYTFFNIYTIDAFFQLILKNMAKELGMPSDFSIILNEEDYNTKAVRNIIAQTINDKELSNWLYHFFIKKQDNNESWNFEKDLNDALKSINNVEQIKSLENDIYKFNNLLNKARTLNKEINEIKRQAQQYLKKFQDVLKKHNIISTDFNGVGNKRTSGVYPKITKQILEFKEPDLISKEVDKFNNDKKDYLQKGQTTPKDLADLISEIDDFLQRNTIRYRSLQLFYKSIYSMGVMKILYEEKLDLQKQDGVFFLSNTKDVLSKLNLKDSDTISFIYEKVGAYLERIMIDEFQDTNVLSWQIFKPLVRECLSAQNGKTFIFGDIKQSIYRWNGGDWRLLNDLSNDKNNQVINLTKNYRTFGNIVDFNNNLFSYIYTGRYQNQEVRDDYKDKGSVEIKFINKKQEDMLQKTIEEVDYYLSLGYKTGDIAILCRNGKKLSELAKKMKELDNTNQGEYKYNPVSDSAFLLGASDAVNLIISALTFLYSEEETVAKEHLLSYQPSIIEDINTLRNSNYKLISLFDIVLTLSEKLQLEDTVFLPAFYDAVKNFATERQGGVKEFLDYWETTLKENKVELSFGENSLRLTTIHKSKGLEYNIVILPYFDWALSKTNDFIWVDNNKNKIIDIPTLRSRISDLKDTEFDGIYQDEIAMQVAESYNLLYVACTRAKKHLSIIATHSQKPKEEKNVGDLLYNYLKQNEESFSSTQERYVYKNVEPVFYENNNQIATTLENLPKQETKTIWFSHNAVVFSSPSLSEVYFREASSNETESKRLFGTNMHNIISMLESRDDIEKYSVFFAKRYEDWEDISKILLAMFDYSKDKFWFEKKYKVLNEKSIILKDKDSKTITKRPDRIMIGQNMVDIVDYKFTQKDKILHEKYIDQIKEYKQLLEQMGYTNVNAFLWYIDTENNKLKSQKIISISLGNTKKE